jgi:anti-sigma factor RsiW
MADHISCQELVDLVTEYLEGALPPEETILFEQHLNFCDGCVVYLEQFRATVGALGRLAPADLSDAARDRLLAAFRDWRQS